MLTASILYGLNAPQAFHHFGFRTDFAHNISRPSRWESFLLGIYLITFEPENYIEHVEIPKELVAISNGKSSYRKFTQ